MIQRFRRGDARLIVELASGKSIRQAARAVGLSEPTVTRRLANPDFCKRLNQARRKLVDESVGILAAAMTEASLTLRRLLKAKAETVRLGAARSIIELHAKLAEHQEIEERLSALEARLNGRYQTPLGADRNGNGHVAAASYR